MGKRKLVTAILLLLIGGTVVLIAGGQTEAKKPVRMSVATCGSSGVWYPIGGGIANLINQNVPGVIASAEATGCSLENARLLKSGEAESCLMMKGPLINAFKGINEFEKDGAIPLYGITNIYASQLAIVTRGDTGINSVSDLRGKKVSVGPPGSGTEVDAKMVLEAAGITYNDLTAQFLGWADSADALADKNIDAFFLVGAHPLGAIVDVSSRTNIKMVPLSRQLLSQILEKRPDFGEGYIPAGSYKGVDAPVLTVETVNSLVVRKDLSDDLVYQITKVLREKRDALVQIHGYMKYVTDETMIKGIPVPLHPGAEKYYREIGAIK